LFLGAVIVIRSCGVNSSMIFRTISLSLSLLFYCPWCEKLYWIASQV